jgi:hypothetical protein
MPFDPEHKRLLHIAGTVALPSPQPAAGSVEIFPSERQADKADDAYLRVTYRISLNVTIKWTVSLKYVSALSAPHSVFPPDSPGTSSPTISDWDIKTADEVERLVLKRIAAQKSGESQSPLFWLQDAILYVPEGAPVLRQAEAGLTAAESAEFIPPPSSVGPAFGCGRSICDPRDPSYLYSPRRDICERGPAFLETAAKLSGHGGICDPKDPGKYLR